MCREARTLFVGGLPETFTTVDLTAVFEQHGHVAEVEVLHSRGSQCFGFVTMQGAEMASTAKAALDGAWIPGGVQGRPLKVRLALTTRTLLVGELGADVTLSQLQEASTLCRCHLVPTCNLCLTQPLFVE